MSAPRPRILGDIRSPIEYRAGQTPGWMADAACSTIGGDLWFPDKSEHAPDAKRICRACPVIAECFEYAMDTDQRHGIWGGTSENKREKLRPEWRRKRGAA